MLFVHPALQFIAIVLSVYVAFLGVNRFRSKHLHQKAVFNWKRHVRLGFIVLVVLPTGLVSGLVIVKVYWYSFLATGIHGYLALTMVPLILFGLASGLYMDRVKKQRHTLPLIHASCNLVLVALALIQIATGIFVVKAYILGV